MENGKVIGPDDFVEVRFELEAVRRLVQRSIMCHAEGLSELVNQEVNKMITRDGLINAIRSQIEEKFEWEMKYGEGATVIKKIVSRKVKETVQRLEEAEK